MSTHEIRRPTLRRFDRGLRDGREGRSRDPRFEGSRDYTRAYEIGRAYRGNRPEQRRPE